MMKKISLKTFFVIIFIQFFNGTIIFADKVMSYPVYLINTPVNIDGKLDDDTWMRLIETTNFKELSKMKPAAKQTYFRLGWDRKYLYVAIKCDELKMAALKGKEPDGGFLFKEDSVELFLSSGEIYEHYTVNSIGSKWTDGKCDNWEAAVARGKDYWAVELKIPLDKLAVDSARLKWKFNVARNTFIDDSDGKRHTTWSPLRNGFHDLKNFRHLKFAHSRLTPEIARKKSTEFNVDIEMVPIEKLRSAAYQTISECKKEIKEIKEPEALREFKKDIAALEEIISDEYSYDQMVKTLGKAKTLREEIIKFNIKSLFQDKD